MVLTAIVITFGVTAFLLAMAYRSWVLTDADEVQDDLEDRRVQQLGEAARGEGGPLEVPDVAAPAEQRRELVAERLVERRGLAHRAAAPSPSVARRRAS